MPTLNLGSDLKTAEVKGEPELVLIRNTFSTYNDVYVNLVAVIEDKLHNIINLRVPEKPSESNPETVPNDFTGSMYQQLSVMDSCNYRLQKVLEHVKRIIG